MLQTRSGKRTAPAAVKIAVDMAAEGLISRDEAILRVDPQALDQLLHPTLDPKAARDVLTKGLPASPVRWGRSGRKATRDRRVSPDLKARKVRPAPCRRPRRPTPYSASRPGISSPSIGAGSRLGSATPT